MHYNGPVVRPLHEAFSVIVETTVGCTHNSSLLYEDIQAGRFKPQTEEDIIGEFRTLLANLQNSLEVDAMAGYNPVRFRVNLPEDRRALLRELDAVLADYGAADELFLNRRRASFASV